MNYRTQVVTLVCCVVMLSTLIVVELVMLSRRG